jgi:pyrroline-5-carboxylate reductase
MHQVRLGFIGAGQMAEAIARGILRAKLLPVGDLMASDVAEPRRQVFDSLGIRSTGSNLDVIRECNVLIVAVKPQNLEELLKEAGPELRKGHLLISICAGSPTTLFESAAAEPVRVVRAMPNLPMRVGMGAIALCPGRHATDADMKLALDIFGAAGKAVRVEERLMDAVTALSGSGPAYVYFLAEAMIEAGCREGLSPEVSKTLTLQTLRGAAEMMLQEDVHPAEHRRRVTSKAGTTEAAFKRIDKLKVRESFHDAIAAAARRARELGAASPSSSAQKAQERFFASLFRRISQLRRRSSG